MPSHAAGSDENTTWPVGRRVESGPGDRGLNGLAPAFRSGQILGAPGDQHRRRDLGGPFAQVVTGLGEALPQRGRGPGAVGGLRPGDHAVDNRPVRRILGRACTRGRTTGYTALTTAGRPMTAQTARVKTLCGVKPPVLTSTTPATRSGRSSANRHAAYPPTELPTTTRLFRSSRSTNSIARSPNWTARSGAGETGDSPWPGQSRASTRRPCVESIMDRCEVGVVVQGGVQQQHRRARALVGVGNRPK